MGSIAFTVLPRLTGTRAQIFWFSSGLASGGFAWCCGSSHWPLLLLKALSGIGSISQSALLLVFVAYIAGNLPWRYRAWATNDFENFVGFSCRFLHRAALVLLGLSLVATIAWLFDAESSAAAAAIAGALLSTLYLLYSVLLSQLSVQGCSAPPNPSIERTAAGKPASAAHVER